MSLCAIIAELFQNDFRKRRWKPPWISSKLDYMPYSKQTVVLFRGQEISRCSYGLRKFINSVTCCVSGYIVISFFKIHCSSIMRKEMNIAYNILFLLAVINRLRVYFGKKEILYGYRKERTFYYDSHIREKILPLHNDIIKETKWERTTLKHMMWAFITLHDHIYEALA